ncbi:MAG: glycosyl hydrolase family 8 [Patescibacteria group bacterium]
MNVAYKIKELSLKKINTKRFSIKKTIFIYSFLISSFYTYFLVRSNLLVLTNYSNIQLESTKIFLDKIATGSVQLGSYHLLSNIIFSIFSINQYLLNSGISLAIPNIIFFAILNVYLYLLIQYVTKNKIAGLLSSLIITLNPNILYFVASGSHFIIYLLLSIMLFYYLIGWNNTNKKMKLFLISILTGGLILLNIISTLYIVIIPLFIYFGKKYKYKDIKKIEATIILFLFIAIIPILYILIYNYYVYQNFIGNINYHIINLPNILTNITHLSENIVTIYGLFFITLSIFSYIYFFLMVKGLNKNNLKIVFILPLIPLLLLIFSIFLQNSNREATLLLLPFIAIPPSLLFTIIIHDSVNLKRLFKYMLFILVIIFSFLNIEYQSYYLNNHNKIYAHNYGNYFKITVNKFKKNYDSGFILANINDDSEILHNININYKFLITKNEISSNKYFKNEPWIYANYIIINKQYSKSQLYGTFNNNINYYYSKIINNKDYEILKFNQNKVKIFALENNINITNIPTLTHRLSNNIYYKSNLVTENSILSEFWSYYKIKYLNYIGNISTKSNITSSKFQSYALLNALYMNQQNTFNNILNWTYGNMTKTGDASAPHYNLFVSSWGKHANGSYGVINTKSSVNADQNIAYALILAAYKWRRSYYIVKAKAILNSIWNNETVKVTNKRYVIAGDWAKNSNSYILNPSYLAPYQYRVFAFVDPSHDWNNIVNTSYTVINNCSMLNNNHIYLPVNYCIINNDGRFNKSNISTRFALDAYQVLWNAGLDYYLNNSKQAYNYLEKTTFFINQWNKNQKIFSQYSINGKVLDYQESLVLYASLIPYFGIHNSKIQEQIYTKKIISQTNFYSTNMVYFTHNLDNENAILSLLYFKTNRLMQAVRTLNVFIKYNINASYNIFNINHI